jgi:hypothetical protein
MVRKANHIIPSIFFLGIILFGIVTVHPECRELLRDLCHQKNGIQEINSINLSFSAIEDSFFQKGPCCKRQPCKGKDALLVSERTSDTSKKRGGTPNDFSYPEKRERESLSVFNVNKKTNHQSIFLITQSFLC